MRVLMRWQSLTEAKAPATKKKTVTGTGNGKNDYLAPKISDMDSKTNAFLIMPRNWDEEPCSRWWQDRKVPQSSNEYGCRK